MDLCCDAKLDIDNNTHWPVLMSKYAVKGDISTILGYYAVYDGNSLPTFRDNISAPIFKG